MNIVIVGLGVIGGSYAYGLKDAGYKNVFGIDINENTIKKAKELNIIKDGDTKGTHLIKNADLVIISLYPDLIKTFMKDNINNFKKGCVITDATGIKGSIVSEILSFLPSDVDFIFAHPMAGREKKGIDYATNKVFSGANFLITPIESNKEENIELIEKIAKEIGFKNVKRISVPLHDEMISFTSQLPHAIAVALINSDNHHEHTTNFIGDSYRDLTRIANINDELWSQLFFQNKENLLSSMENFEKQFNIIKNALLENDETTLKECFKSSSKRRELLDK